MHYIPNHLSKPKIKGLTALENGSDYEFLSGHCFIKTINGLKFWYVIFFKNKNSDEFGYVDGSEPNLINIKLDIVIRKIMRDQHYRSKFIIKIPINGDFRKIYKSWDKYL
jgi:hypothetical protein